MKRNVAMLFCTLILLGGCVSGFGKNAKTDMTDLKLGMSHDEVSQTIGAPLNVVEAEQVGNRRFEVWEYPAGRHDRFRVYFTDGKVEAWRRTPN